MFFDKACILLLVTALIAEGNCGNIQEVGTDHGRNVYNLMEAPYMAAVLVGNQLECSATIVHKLFLLTTANCVSRHSVDHYHVSVGTNIFYSGGYNYKIDKIIRNENHKHNSLDYDIALIKVVCPQHPFSLIFDMVVNKINIAAEDLLLYKNSQLKILGWGKSGSRDSSILQTTAVKVVSPMECKRDHDFVTPRMFCASNGYCKGDEGGPAIIDGDQVGIIPADTIPCSDRSKSQVYIYLSPLRTWINETITLNL